MNENNGVSMGASLGPVFIRMLLWPSVKKFYIPYVDDTLIFVKHQDIDKVLKAFNRFDNNLTFTYRW